MGVGYGEKVYDVTGTALENPVPPVVSGGAGIGGILENGDGVNVAVASVEVSLVPSARARPSPLGISDDAARSAKAGAWRMPTMVASFFRSFPAEIRRGEREKVVVGKRGKMGGKRLAFGGKVKVEGTTLNYLIAIIHKGQEKQADGVAPNLVSPQLPSRILFLLNNCILQYSGLHIQSGQTYGSTLSSIRLITYHSHKREFGGLSRQIF